MNEDRLSELYRLGTRPGSDRREDCLDPATVLAAIEGEPSAREHAVDHAGRCSACAEDLRLALGLEGLAEVRREPRTSVRWLRLAASIAIGAGLALAAMRIVQVSPDDPAAIRGEADSTWSDTTPADRATISAAPTRLAWAPRPAATEYSAAIVDEESKLIWESPRVSIPRADLPEEVVDRLHGGGVFYWRVTVWGARGASTSPLLRFEVRP
jgi:hypothetical protein